MRYPKQSFFITHYLAYLIEDLLLQNGLQELHFIVTPQLGQVQAFVLNHHTQLFAVARSQLLDLLLNQLQALNKWLANRLITAITELAYRT